MRRRRFWTPKMQWLPKSSVTSTVFEESLSAQGLIFGQTAVSELVDPLVDNLTHLWKMNETGSQTDSVGTLNLTARNSPVQVAAVVANGQQYATSAMHYSNLGILGTNNPFSIDLWVRSDSAPSSVDNFFFALENNTGETFSIRHRLSTNKILASMSPDSGTTQYIVESTVTPSVGTWYHVTVVYTVDTTLQMWTNNADLRSIGALNGRANGRLAVAARLANGTGAKDVSVDALHWWGNYALTSDDRTYMHNAGSGRELV